MASVLSTASFAAEVYNNSINSQNSFFGSANEFGDQIDLAGTERQVTTFRFDYFLSPAANNNETVNFRIYNNDGPNGPPTQLLYESGPISIVNRSEAGYGSVTIEDLEITVQDTLTWTVLFGGIDPFETAGLLMYDPPVVGKSFDDYWEKGPNGAWATMTFGEGDPQNLVANFGAVVSAVPEPGTVQLALVGGLVWLGFAAKRRFLGQN